MAHANGIIAYYRVSTRKQGIDGLGIEAQQEAVKRYAASCNADLIAEFREVESGRKNDRPELHKAISRCRQTGATLVIARLDRLSRNAAFVMKLMESGVNFVACDMPQANNFTIKLLAVFAEQEAELIRARVQAALNTKKAKGANLGRNQEFTDEHRRRGTLVKLSRHESDEYQVCKDVIQARYSLGESPYQIARLLNSRGYRTVLGKSWHSSTVITVIKRYGFNQVKTA